MSHHFEECSVVGLDAENVIGDVNRLDHRALVLKRSLAFVEVAFHAAALGFHSSAAPYHTVVEPSHIHSLDTQVANWMKVEAPLVVCFVLDSAAELEEQRLSELAQSLVDWYFEPEMTLARCY